jgi:membrane dipeptidase
MRPMFDAHLDLAWCALHWNRDLTLPLKEMRQVEAHMTDHAARGHATVSLPEMRGAGIAVCLSTILSRSKPEAIPPSGGDRRTLDSRNQTIASAVGQGQLAYYRLLEQQGQIRLLLTSEDLTEHWAAWIAAPDTAPLGIILAMEGADPIVDPSRAADWQGWGLRCCGLAHYGPHPYASGTGHVGPVTPAGREMLKEFQKLGIIVDMTHTSEPGFFEVLDHFDGPVHASHNMCRSLVPGDRQFSDEQLRRLIERDAVIGMALDAWMIAPGWIKGVTQPSAASLSMVVDHIDHICQMAGNTRHVGIGSDLDGGFGTEQTPGDLNTIADLQIVAGLMEKRGYTQADIDGVFFGNWLRFFTAALPKRG